MAKPKIALVPAAQGSKFYSVLPSSGVGDFTFSRSGSATRINSQGLIETVGSGVSRLNYPMIDGVVSGCPHHILEPARTNLIPFSEDFSQSAWTKSNSSITSNSVISPDGTQNADKLIPNATSSVNKYIYTIPTTSNGIDYTLTVFAKEGEYDMLRLEDGNNSKGAWFDLSNGTLGTVGASVTAKIQNYGNGWYRCSVTKPSVSTSVFFVISASNTESIQVGDGTSGVYIFGAMLEEGSYPTSYIPNYGTALGVTRSSEIANGSGDADTFNDSEGVLMAEISALSDTVSAYNSIGLGNNSAFNRIGLGFQAPSTVYVYKHDGSNSWLPSETIDINSFNKVALSYKTNDNHFWVNGFKLASNTTIEDVSNITELDFQASYGGEKFYGNTKQVQYYDSALTDNELEQLTSWTSFNEMAISQQYSLY